eukprot:TRINITY_DN45405_c0_g1_i3.p2 TRINITY_DN45405_c0_g1~~TRINITY_DN45405_c0_g1_i3.p2  ORF type:complete len:165 (+),score=28.46 TRINITY_DN45405_c0_g1_i3:82-576(+)
MKKTDDGRSKDACEHPEDAVPRPLPKPSSAKKLEGFDFFRSIGSPRHILAPMVEYSELPYRMLCRNYGAQLAYTPMIHSRLYVEQKRTRKEYFQPCEEDRPLFGHFCGNDPETILKAAKMVEEHVDAVDVNLGCPQGIAKRGHYGSFLMEEWGLVESIGTCECA